MTVGGEYAGEGFIGSNQVHTFILIQRDDGFAWEDLTAENIYCSKTRNYLKKRDGLIEQWGYVSDSAQTVTYPIPYITKPTLIVSIYGSSNQAMTIFSFGYNYNKTSFYVGANSNLQGRSWRVKGY